MEKEKVDTLEDFYLTCSTFMIQLIDTNTLERMMKRVINDILSNENSIIENIQKMDLDTRLLLGKTLYDWIKRERYFVNGSIEKKSFFDKFEEAFSKDVIEECKYLDRIKDFSYTINKKKNIISITVYPYYYLPKRDMVNRAILKLDEAKNILKLSYIETGFYGNKEFEVEIFYYINKIYKDMKFKNKNLKFLFNKKYQDIYEKAIKREYLKDIV